MAHSRARPAWWGHPRGEMDATEQQPAGPGLLVPQLRDAALGLCSSVIAHQQRRRERLMTLRTQSSARMGHARSRTPASPRSEDESRVQRGPVGARPMFCSISMAATHGEQRFRL